MGLKTVIIYVSEIILGLVLTPLLGIPGILIGLGLVSATFLLRRRGRKWEKSKPLMTEQRPMRLRQFISLLWLVALVAILFSPSVRFGLGGGSTPLAVSFQAVQPYLAHLESKYEVTIINDTDSLQS